MSQNIEVSTVEFREKMGQLLNELGTKENRITLIRHKKPAGVVLSSEELADLDWSAQFTAEVMPILMAIRKSLRDDAFSRESIDDLMDAFSRAESQLTQRQRGLTGRFLSELSPKQLIRIGAEQAFRENLSPQVQAEIAEKILSASGLTRQIKRMIKEEIQKNE